MVFCFSNSSKRIRLTQRPNRKSFSSTTQWSDGIILATITHNSTIAHDSRFILTTSFALPTTKGGIFPSNLPHSDVSTPKKGHRDANKNVISRDEQRFTRDEYFSSFYGLRMGWWRAASETISFRLSSEALAQASQLFNEVNNYFNVFKGLACSTSGENEMATGNREIHPRVRQTSPRRQGKHNLETVHRRNLC